MSVTLGLRAPHGATAELPLGVLGTGGWTGPSEPLAVLAQRPC